MTSKTSKYKYLLEPNNLVIGGIILGIIIVLVFVIVNLFASNKSKSQITEDQIMIQKGGNTVIVNKNGLIEYRSGDEVFYKTWDSNKISYFFSRMEARAREYLKNESGPCEGCYAVTLYVDGKLVTIYITDDEDLDDTFEEFPDNEDGNGGDDISDYFDEDDGSSNGGNTVLNSPTPSVFSISTPSPTPTQIVQGNQQTNYPPVEADCSSWSQDIVDKAIISNTLCTVIEE